MSLLAKELNPAWTSTAPARSALYGGVLGQDGGSKPQACSTTDAASVVAQDDVGDCNGLRSSSGAPLLVMMSATESTRLITTACLSTAPASDVVASSTQAWFLFVLDMAIASASHKNASR